MNKLRMAWKASYVNADYNFGNLKLKKYLKNLKNTLKVY